MRLDIFRGGDGDEALQKDRQDKIKDVLNKASVSGITREQGAPEYKAYAKTEGKAAMHEIELLLGKRLPEAKNTIDGLASAYADAYFWEGKGVIQQKFLNLNFGSLEHLASMVGAKGEDIGSLQLRHILPTLTRILAEDKEYRELGFTSKQEARDKLEQASLTVRTMEPDAAAELLSNAGLIARPAQSQGMPKQDYTTSFITDGKFKAVHYPQYAEGPDLAENREKLAQVLVPVAHMIWKIAEMDEVSGDSSRFERDESGTYDLTATEKARFAPLHDVIRNAYLKGKKAAPEVADSVVLGLLYASVEVSKDLWQIRQAADIESRESKERT